jgi:hypothetical protein
MQRKTFLDQLLIALTRTSPAFAPERRKVRARYTTGSAPLDRQHHRSGSYGHAAKDAVWRTDC